MLGCCRPRTATATLAADTRSLLRGRRLCVHVCLCQPELHAGTDPFPDLQRWKKPPFHSAGPGRGSGSSANPGRADNAAGFTILTAPSLFQRRAGLGTLPCLCWDRAGSPALPPALATQATKKDPYFQQYVSVCTSSWDTGVGRHRSTAGSCGFVDERWRLRLALVPVQERCPQQRGYRDPPPDSTELTWMALRILGKPGGFGCPWRLAEVWVCSGATFARSHLHTPSLQRVNRLATGSKPL